MHRVLFAVLIMPLVAGCVGDAGRDRAASSTSEQASSPSTVASPGSCALVELERRYLRLEGGDFAYVEAQHLAREADGWLVAGQPSYRVRVDRSGRGAITERGAWFGVTVTDAGARPVPRPAVPAGARIVWARGAPSPGQGRPRFVYEVVEGVGAPPPAPLPPVSLGPEADSVSRLVFAELDPGDGTWRTLDELPPPPHGRLRGLDAVAGPVGAGGSPDAAAPMSLPVLAVPHELPQGGVDVLLYRREGRGWTSTVASRRWVDEIAIADGGGGEVVLALAGLDPDFGARRASIRTVRRDVRGRRGDDAGSPRHQYGSPGERFVSPRFARAAGRLDLGWLRRGPSGPPSAWVSPGVGGRKQGRVGPGAQGPFLIDRGAAQIVPLDGSDASSLWLTGHMPDPALGGPGSIVATLVGPAGTIEAGSVPNPFHGPFAALRVSAAELLVVGPEARFDPTSPYVRSLVLRLSIRCIP